MNNLQKITNSVKEIISATSRIPIDELKDNENLIELGADSILLMSVNASIKKKFDIEIPMNQYFDQLTSINAIADHIYSHVGAHIDLSKEPHSTLSASDDMLPEIVDLQANSSMEEQKDQAVKNQSITPAILDIPVMQPPVDFDQQNNNHLTSLFMQQLSVMQNQLSILGINPKEQNIQTQSKSMSEAKSPATELDEKNENQSIELIKKPVISSNANRPHKTSGITCENRSKEQRKIINNFCEKTNLSKDYMKKYRSKYADPRHVAGFRRDTKEMMYQMVFKASSGSRIVDIDDNEYIDLTMNFGANILGHNNEAINAAIRTEMEAGFPLSFISGLTGEVAALISEMTNMDRVTFFNSGTEAVMAGIRIARAYTRRSKAVIFSGSYHGSFDGVLGIKNYTSDSNLATPLTNGILQSMVDDLIVLDYGSSDALEFIENNKNDIAIVLTEALQSRRPDFQPGEFLHELRSITNKSGVLLMFDEIITGFRLGFGGAQEYYDIQADLACYGKVCGGGMPIGVLAGKVDIMGLVDGGMWNYGDDSVPPFEDKRTFIAGTFSHHPLTMAATKALLQQLKEKGEELFSRLNQNTKSLCNNLNLYFIKNKVPIRMVYCGSLFRFVLKGDLELFYNLLLLKGVYVWEGRNCFLSDAHSDDDLEKVYKAVVEACEELRPFYADEETDVREDAKIIPITDEQRKMLVFEAIDPTEDAFCERLLVRINGEINLDLLQEAWKRVVARHEILRCKLANNDSHFVVNETYAKNFQVVTADDGDIHKIIKDLGQNRLNIYEEAYRTTIVKQQVDADKQYYFIIEAHHVLLDGWSLSVIYQEVVEQYNSLWDGNQPQLLPKMSMSEHFEAIEERKSKLNSREIEDFITNYFTDLIEKTPLPTRGGISKTTTCGRSFRINKSIEYLKDIRRTAARLNTSSFMLYLAAFQTLLHEITGQNHITIGVPIAAQMQYPEKTLVGNCVTIRPVSCSIHNNTTLSALVDGNKKLFADFDKMCDIAPEDFEMSNVRNPQLNVVFNMDRVPRSIEFKETVSKFIPLDPTRAKYDLFINVWELSNELVVNVDYRSANYSSATISQWVNLLFMVIDEAIINHDFSIQELELYHLKDEQECVKAINKLHCSQIEKTLALSCAEYGITEKERYCIIKSDTNKPVVTGSYGNLYIGKDKHSQFSTGYVARIDWDYGLDVIGHARHCVIKNGDYINCAAIADHIRKHVHVRDAQVTVNKFNQIIEVILDMDDYDLFDPVYHWIIQNLSVNQRPEAYFRIGQNGESTIELTPDVDTSKYTETEKHVSDILINVMEVSYIAPDTDLFQLGIDSLKMLSIIDAIQDRFSTVRLTMAQFASITTLRSIASFIDNHKISEDFPKLIASSVDQVLYEAAPVQKRLFLLDKLNNNNAVAFNISFLVKFNGDVDIRRIREAMKACINKHQIFKSKLMEHDDDVFCEIEQEVHEVIIGFEKINGSRYIEEILDLQIADFVKPFDLSTSPLYRIKVIQFSANSCYILFDFHHSIFDGTSGFIFAQDFLAAYITGSELPPLEISYMDYIAWQKLIVDTKAYKEQEAYWQKVFEIPTSNLDILQDHPRKANREMSCDLIQKNISTDLSDAIESMCRGNGITMFSFFSAMVTLTISLYTGETDITLGTVTSGRNHLGLADIVGMFVNTLPMRSNVNYNLTGKEFLQLIHNNNMNLMTNSDVTFDRILELVSVVREHNRNPLFDIMLTYDDMSNTTVQTEFGHVEFVELPVQKAQFDLEFKLVSKKEDYQVKIVYADELYSEGTVKRLLETVESCMECIVQNPSKRLSEMDFLNISEKNKILIDFNDTRIGYSHNSVVELFALQVRKTPDHAAVRYHDLSLTYKELDEKTNALAFKLQEIGIHKGDFVVLLAKRNIETIIGILATIKVGAVYVPVDPSYPPQRIAYIIDNCSPKIILVSSPTLIDTPIPILNLADEDLYEGDLYFEPESLLPNDLIYCIYTSGTTGKPKGVLIEHKGVIRLVKQPNFIKLDHETVILQTGSVAFDASTFEIWGALVNGGTLVLGDSDILLNLQALRKYITTHKVNTMILTTALFNQLVQENPKAFDELSFLIVGGEKLPDRYVREFKKYNSSTELINGYGPAENTTVTTAYKIPNNFQSISIGSPINNTQVYILRKEQLCGVMMPGELCTSGVGVARGYLKNNELTNKKFVANPYGSGKLYRTGDLARWLPDGNIDYLNRIDDQVKIRGFRIELEEIAAVIREIEGIKNVALDVREDHTGDKAIYAYIISDELINVKKISQSLENILPKYMIPTHFMQIDKIPITQNGKLDRNSLPEIQISSMEKYIAPRNQLEQRVADIFGKILEVERVGVRDNFFELGGHSLKVTSLINHIESETGTRLSYSAIFTHPTVEALCESINEVKADTLSVIPIASELPMYAMSSAQKRIYILCQMDDVGVAYNMPGFIRVKGEIDHSRIHDSINKLAARHDAFRTSFDIVNEEAVQIIAPSVQIELESRTTTTSKTKKAIYENFIQPFNLSKAPLFRCQIIETGTDESILLFDMHHIVSDGISMNQLIWEFSELYNGNELEPIRIQYKDYSEWFKNLNIEKQKEYWRKEFADMPTVLELPLDFSRQSGQNFSGSTVQLELDKKLRKKIKDIAKKTATTEYMIMLTAFMILMNRYTHQEDIVIGSLTSGRSHKDTENIIGMFVNTLALRGKPTVDKSFYTLLNEVRDKCLLAYENQDLPFDKVLDIIDVHRTLSRNPLFDVMFDMQTHGEPDLHLLGVEVSEVDTEYALTSKFDLSMTVVNKGDGYSVLLEYCINLFCEETMMVMINHYKNILLEVLNKPEVPIAQLNEFDENEYALIMTKFNNTNLDYDKQKTVLDLFQNQVDRLPNKDALIHNDRAISYVKLDKMSSIVAASLREKGVGTNDFVALLTTRSIEMIIGIWGVLKAGAAYIPLDPNYPDSRIKFILNDAKPKVILVYNTVINTSIPVIDLSNISIYEQLACRNYAKTNPKDLAYCIYTSGTTGNPKGVLINHRNLHNFIVAYNKEYALTEADIVLQTANYVFDASVWEIFNILSIGGTLCIISHETLHNPDAIADYCNDNRVTVLSWTPSMIAELEPKNFKTLRLLDSGGEDAKAMLKEWVSDERMVTNTYGPTEATVISCIYFLTGMEKRSKIPIGKPGSNVKIYILDGVRLCGIGVPGELCIAGDGVAQGYLNQPELTEEKFINNPFADGLLYRSGDLARWLPDGNIEYLGRKDDQVKIRGFRIELGEIAHKMMNNPLIQDAVVLVREKNGDKYLCGYIVGSKGINVDDIRAQLSDSLPDYMIPASIIKLDSLPVTVSGKLDQKALPVPEFSGAQAYIEPLSIEEKDIVAAFEKIFGITSIGTRAGFFELGGDSIKALRIAALLTEKGYEISMPDIIRYQSPKKLASRLQIDQSYNKSVEIEQPNEKMISYESMSKLMKAVYLAGEEYSRSILDSDVEEVLAIIPVQKMSYDLGVRSISMIFDLPSMDVSDIRRAWNVLIKIHSLLRSSLTHTNELKHTTIYTANSAVDIPAVDLSHIDPKEASTVTTHVLQSLDQYDFDEYYRGNYLANFPIIFKIDDYCCKLVFVSSHLIFDGFSAEVLLRDIYEIHHGGEIISMQELPRYNDYISMIQKEPKGISEKELIEHLNLAEFSECFNLITNKVNEELESINFSYRLADDINLSNEEIMLLAEHLYVEALRFTLGYDKIPLLAVHSGRGYEGYSFENHIGEFLDVIPMVIDAEQKEGISKKMSALLKYVRNHNINMATLVYEPKPAFKNVQRLLSRVDLRNLNIPAYNYVGMYQVSDLADADMQRTILRDRAITDILIKNQKVLMNLLVPAGKSDVIKSYLEEKARLFLQNNMSQNDTG